LLWLTAAGINDNLINQSPY